MSDLSEPLNLPTPPLSVPYFPSSPDRTTASAWAFSFSAGKVDGFEAERYFCLNLTDASLSYPGLAFLPLAFLPVPCLSSGRSSFPT